GGRRRWYGNCLAASARGNGASKEKTMIHLVEPDDHIPLTAPGREQIAHEVERIEARLAELRDLIADAREDRTADEDERAGAMAMLDEVGRGEARLAELRAILERSVVAAGGADQVELGSNVRVREEDGEENVYTLVNP